MSTKMKCTKLLTLTVPGVSRHVTAQGAALCAAPSTFSAITFLVIVVETKTNPVNLSFDNAETMV